MLVKERSITLQKTKTALYQKLSADITVILYIVCIIFFANEDSSMMFISSLLWFYNRPIIINLFYKSIYFYSGASSSY